MRRIFVLAAVLWTVACTSSGSISGKVIVGPGQDGLAVFAILWEQQSQTQADGTTRPRLVALGTLSLGVAQAGTSTFDYTFHGLPKGTYVVGAYADLHDDRDITDDAVTVDVASPLDIDPADDAKRFLTHDVFLAASAPDRGTLKGTVHAGSGVGDSQVAVFVLDGALNNPSAVVVGSTGVASGSTTPFEVFNVTEGARWLLAQADVGNDGDESNDLYALYPLNPVQVQAGKVIDGLDLWLGTQGPDLGTIAGTLALNAPLSTLQVQLVVLAASAPGGGAPVLADDAPIEAIVNVDARSKREVPFQIPSLRPGAHFLAAVVESRDADGVTRRATRIYSVANKETAIDTRQEAAQSLRFPLGVGRCSGRITVKGAPAELRTVAVFALVPGGDISPGVPGSPVVRDALGVGIATTNGAGQASYQLFGLEDGTYDMALIPDLNGDGSFQEEYSAGRIFNGTPLRVTVAGGGRVSSDFDVTLAP